MQYCGRAEQICVAVPAVAAARAVRAVRAGTSAGLRLSGDARWLCAGQAVRAAGYGFTAVLLGAFLATSGYSHLRAGVLLTAIIAGTASASLVVAVL